MITKEQARSLITQITEATARPSVTNPMVGAVLEYLDYMQQDNAVDCSANLSELRSAVLRWLNELKDYTDQSDQEHTRHFTEVIGRVSGRVSDLEESIGDPADLARLDSSGFLEMSQLNPDTVSVRVFHGFVEDVKVETVGVIVKPGQLTRVVYDTARRKFLLQVIGYYYEAWPEASAYNGTSGEIPGNRLYVYAIGRSIWWWNGAELTKVADLPATEQLGESVSRLESEKLDRSEVNRPGGVAGLDESGKIEASMLPDVAQTAPRGPLVCVFDGWTDESPALGALVPGQGRGEVIYDRERGTFVSHEMMGSSYGWFGEWTGDASFGEPLGPFQGVRPVADRFYFCPTGSGLWWWDGTQLTDVSGCSGSATPPAITPGEIDDLLQSPPAPPEPSDTEPPSITLDEIDELLRP